MSVRTLLFNTIRKNIKNPINILRRLSSSDQTNPQHILSSSLPDIEIPKISIPEYLISKCEKYMHLTATECGLTGRKYTYGDIFTKSKNLAKAFRKKLNLREGDVIAILLANTPEYPLAVLGALQAGLIVTTLNPVYTKDEITRQLVDSSAKALITMNDLWGVANSSTQSLPFKLPILVIKTEQAQSLPLGAIDFNEFANNPLDLPDLAPRNSDDIAILPYSSGTTGLPKGVQLTHYNIVANVCQNSSPDLPFIEETTDQHQDVIPVILPMFHIYGFSVNTIFIMSKGTLAVTLPKFTPEDYVGILRKYRPDILFLVPPIILFLSGHPMVKKDDLQSVRVTFSGAAPLGALDEQRFIEKAGKSVHMLQGYGLTETSPTVTAVSIENKLNMDTSGSIGMPVPNTMVKVVDIETGASLGPNKTGELLVKGPQVMKGYHNRPEETEITFKDGWLRTGDVAYYNEDKLLYITDRLKELIKVKGFQVPPAELEEVIRNFPSVVDAAVIGVPHPSQGEAPRAYIVTKKDAKINIKELEEYVKSKVAPYKQLKGGIAIVDSIPKNASGKIMRRVLKLDYEKSMKSK